MATPKIPTSAALGLVLLFQAYVLFKLYDGYIFNDCVKCTVKSRRDSLFPVGGVATEEEVKRPSIFSVSVRKGLRGSYQKAFIIYLAGVYVMRANDLDCTKTIAATIMLNLVVYSLFLSECTTDFLTFRFCAEEQEDGGVRSGSPSS